MLNQSISILNTFYFCFKGYKLHLMSTFSEWIMGISFVVYLMTFYCGLKRMQPYLPVTFGTSPRHRELSEDDGNIDV